MPLTKDGHFGFDDAAGDQPSAAAIHQEEGHQAFHRQCPAFAAYAFRALPSSEERRALLGLLVGMIIPTTTSADDILLAQDRVHSSDFNLAGLHRSLRENWEGHGQVIAQEVPDRRRHAAVRNVFYLALALADNEIRRKP